MCVFFLRIACVFVVQYSGRLRATVQAGVRARQSARRPRVARQLTAWPPSLLPSRPVLTRSASTSAVWPKSAGTFCNTLVARTRRRPSPEQSTESTPSLSACLSSVRCAGAPSPFSSGPRARAVAVHTPAARARRQSCPLATNYRCPPRSPNCCLVAEQRRPGDRFPSLGKQEEPSLARSLSWICGFSYPESPNPKFHPSFSLSLTSSSRIFRCIVRQVIRRET
jgi:hypothetical protein